VILCNRQGAKVAREAKKWEKFELNVSNQFSLHGDLGVLAVYFLSRKVIFPDALFD
jgi:hypothetical protein